MNSGRAGGFGLSNGDSGGGDLGGPLELSLVLSSSDLAWILQYCDYCTSSGRAQYYTFV